MNIHKPHILLLIILLIFGASCHRDTPEISSNPVLTYISLTPDTVREYGDSLLLVLGYEDRDGDMGSADPEEKVLVIKDSRLAEPDYYHLQPLSPPDTSVHIRGKINIHIPSLFLLSNDSLEKVIYTITTYDQKGNWSDPVFSDPVIVIR